MAFWVYSLPLGIQSGVGSGSIRMIVSAANGAQIIAGFAAIALAGRVSGFHAVIATAIASATAMLVTIMGGSVALWLPALLVFAFCWMFAPPFHIAFLITADSSGRAAMFVSTAQLVGMAVGPLIASLVANTTNYGPARLVSIACFVAVTVLATVIYRQAPRDQGGTPLG
jgi:fucose permease